jgi:hypothetical protein
MKTMKFYTVTAFTFLFTLLFISSPVLAQQLNGNGKVQTQTRNLSEFKGINASGGYTIEITQGATESIRLEADENLLDHIKTEVKNGVLHIYNNRGMSTSNGLKAYITIKELNKIDISGGVKVVGTSTFKTNTMDIDLSGGSKVWLGLDVKNLKADMSGASQIELSGKAASAFFELSGASQADAKELEVKSVKVEASSASRVKVHAVETLTISASGASAVYYKGSPNISPVTYSAATITKL